MSAAKKTVKACRATAQKYAAAHAKNAKVWDQQVKHIKSLSAWSSFFTQVAISAAAVATGTVVVARIAPMITGGLAAPTMIVSHTGRAFATTPTLAGRVATWMATAAGKASAAQAVTGTAAWIKTTLFGVASAGALTAAQALMKTAPAEMKADDKALIERAINEVFAIKTAPAILAVATSGAPVIGEEAARRANERDYHKELSFFMRKNNNIGLTLRDIDPAEMLREASVNYACETVQQKLWSRADEMLLQIDMRTPG